jgi:hypothetical protein
VKRSKSKRYGYKDLLLGKLTIPKSWDNLDPEKNANKIKIGELDKDAYSDLVLSIGASTSAGKDCVLLCSRNQDSRV